MKETSVAAFPMPPLNAFVLVANAHKPSKSSGLSSSSTQVCQSDTEAGSRQANLGTMADSMTKPPYWTNPIQLVSLERIICGRLVLVEIFVLFCGSRIAIERAIDIIWSLFARCYYSTGKVLQSTPSLSSITQLHHSTLSVNSSLKSATSLHCTHLTLFAYWCSVTLLHCHRLTPVAWRACSITWHSLLNGITRSTNSVT